MQIQKIIADSLGKLPPSSSFLKKLQTTESSAILSTQLPDIAEVLPNFIVQKASDAGLRVFEGMTKKEIAFILNDLHVMSIGRGCSHKCIHCYASAMPAGRTTETYISKMPYEDFENVLNGISSAKDMGIEMIHSQHLYTSLFYDSDCMEVVLKDKLGKEHDFTDLHELFYRLTGEKTVFDTAGWNHRSQRLQERAEKYVDYLSKNNDKLYQINLSINPYNIMYQKALELGYNPAKYSTAKLAEAPKTSGEAVYRLFIDQMANMLYTFTPLLGKDNFGIIVRLTDSSFKSMAPYNQNAYKTIRANIISRLYQMYLKDFQTSQKFVKSQNEILYNLEQYTQLLNQYSTNVILSGRYKELFMSRTPKATDKDLINMDRALELSKINALRIKFDQSPAFVNLNYSKFINTDGRVYLFDNFNLIPTELKLNLSTNDKKVPDLLPHVLDDFVLTREMINKM